MTTSWRPSEFYELFDYIMKTDKYATNMKNKYYDYRNNIMENASV
jgi:hypothetical protein